MATGAAGDGGDVVDTEGEKVEATGIMAQFYNEEGDATSPQMQVPVGITVTQLDELLNKALGNDEELPYSYWIGEDEVTESISTLLLRQQREAFIDDRIRRGKRVKRNDGDQVKLVVPTEVLHKIIFRPQAVFRVRSVTRCSSSLSGHREAVVVVAFSPDGQTLITGSGDTTIRVWDLNTETSMKTLTAHTGWVQALAWSPNGKYFASGSRDTKVVLWDTAKMEPIGKPHSAHRSYISAISWEPLHRNLACDRVATSSKDCTVKVWKVGKPGPVLSLSGHTAGVTCVKWGGQGFIYTSSMDRTIRVWKDTDGSHVRTLEGHGHWVNFMALNTDPVLRTGAFDHTDEKFDTPEAAQTHAIARYQDVLKKSTVERLVSASDDHTLYMWSPTESSKPIHRLTGHMQAVLHVSFSPDGCTVASASFDKCVKLWNATDGRYVATLRGHVGAVYQVSWSTDSRLCLTASHDSTLKVWSMKTKKVLHELPGHADEVYASDWSPDGLRVASGSKDKTVKIWRH